MAETTICVEGSKSFFLASPATILADDRELAWAERTIKPNPALKFVLGKFCEADQANLNKQFWALDQLRLAQPSITYAPMNLLHSSRIVGTFIDTEMMYPIEENASVQNPYIEALGAFWRYYFPAEYAMISQAHSLGSLSLSMECVADSLTCAGDAGCGETYPYEGPKSMSYCSHINRGESIKQLNNPHFLAGALIVPPEKPGWPGASVKDLSSLVEEHRLEAEMAYEGFREATPHLGPVQWEYLMGTLLERAHAETAQVHAIGASMMLSQDVGHFPAGTPCTVSSSHDGPFYGMDMGQGPIYYVPEHAMTPNVEAPDPINNGIYARYEPSAALRTELQRLQDEARDFNAEQRKKAAQSGAAMPDGSFPIKNAEDLKNAIRLAGNAKNPAAAKAHIRKRAVALGMTNMLPDSWKS